MVSAEKALCIKICEYVITNKQVIADHFDEFFINVASKLTQPLKFLKFERLNNFINLNVTDDVSFVYLYYLFLSSMDGIKSTCMDCVWSRLLKKCP